MSEGELALELGARVAVTTAEGPGLRFSVWVQGCSLRCPGCCNPRMLAPGRGTRVSVAALAEELARAHAEHGVDGLTVLGGEPLEQLPGVTALCERARALGLGVLVFTGLRLDEARTRPGFCALWACIDTLVDGRYDARQPEPGPEHGGRRFIGSRNQALRHRTDRYRDPALWRGPPRIEAHVGEDGELTLHGEPGAVGELLRALGRPGSRSRTLASVG